MELKLTIEELNFISTLLKERREKIFKNNYNYSQYFIEMENKVAKPLEEKVNDMREAYYINRTELRYYSIRNGVNL